jgi:RHS repeat-associated protein
VDNTGTVRNHIIYNSQGKVIFQSSPGTSSRYLFAGREFDPETGLYYLRARYYDPATGRFLSQDPRHFSGGDINLYRYALNRLLNLIDPTGRDWLDPFVDVADIATVGLVPSLDNSASWRDKHNNLNIVVQDDAIATEQLYIAKHTHDPGARSAAVSEIYRVSNEAEGDLSLSEEYNNIDLALIRYYTLDIRRIKGEADALIAPPPPQVIPTDALTLGFLAAFGFICPDTNSRGTCGIEWWFGAGLLTLLIGRWIEERRRSREVVDESDPEQRKTGLSELPEPRTEEFAP